MWFPAAALAADPEPVVAAPPTRPPNVLILVADDVGTDKVSGYGEHPNPPQTPVLDSLARQGVRFRNAYGYPMCSPTRAALLTGRYARRTGMGAIVTWNSRWEVPVGEVLIPELLDRSGTDWSTAMIGKWHLSGPRTPNAYHHPNLQGFDHAVGSINNLYFDEDHDRGRGETHYYHWERFSNGVVNTVDTYATVVTTDDALAWVKTAQEPWFLYVAYNSAHAPFQVPPNSSVSANAPTPARYAAMVEDLDREIGRLLSGLPAGAREHTLVVFTGDNGTAQGAVTPPRVPEQAKGSLFEGGTNVPFIVAGPGVFGGGTTDALVHVVDVLPTVAEWVGVDPAKTGAPLDGVSFADALRTPSSPGRRQFVYTEKFGPAGPPPYPRPPQRAVRDERYKLVVSADGEWFYDLFGRNDDGPGRRPEALTGDEKVRYDALVAELARVERDTPFAW